MSVILVNNFWSMVVLVCGILFFVFKVLACIFLKLGFCLGVMGAKTLIFCCAKVYLYG